MITIIDYDTGNLCSVENALKRIGAEYRISADKELIFSSDKVILPGVGEASEAMRKLAERGLVETISSLTQPVLGICLGMQLLCRHSEEGDTACLNILPNRVKLLKRSPENKVPNIGWDAISELKSPLFAEIEPQSFVYYVHSYAAEVNQYTLCTSLHSEPFSGAIGCNNFYGCQFHPEKSGAIGTQILKNFMQL